MVAALDVDWTSVQRLYAAGMHTFDQLAEIFGVRSAAIRKRASRCHWSKLRDAVFRNVTKPGSESELTEKAVAIVTSAAKIAGGKSTFRERVAGQLERVLTHLDGFPDPQSDREADSRLTVLEKAERVGSRAYGLTQDDAPQLLINFNALNGSDFEKAPFWIDRHWKQHIPRRKRLEIIGEPESSTAAISSDHHLRRPAR